MKPTDAELRKLYEQTKDNYRRPASAHVLHILVKSEPGATPQADAAAKAKAEGIVAQLRGGADFATLARAELRRPVVLRQRRRHGLGGHGQDRRAVRARDLLHSR